MRLLIVRHVTWVAFCALLMGCGEESWRAEIYPDARVSESYVIGHYSDFTSCQEAAIGHIRAKGIGRSASYLCGLNCGARADLGGMMVCETTKR